MATKRERRDLIQKASAGANRPQRARIVRFREAVLHER